MFFAQKMCWIRVILHGTREDQDFGFAHDDHYPVCLQVHGWWPVHRSGPQVRWDRMAMLDPVRCKQFQDALKTLPIPRWDVHINGYAKILQDSVLQLAGQFFTTQGKEKKRPRLSEAALALIQLRRSALDYGRRNDLMHDEEYKMELKSLEKEIRRQSQGRTNSSFLTTWRALSRKQVIFMTSRVVYKTLSRLGGRRKHKSGQKRPLPLIRDPHGVPVRTYMKTSSGFGFNNLHTWRAAFGYRATD